MQISGDLIPLSAVILGIGLAFWRVYWDHQRKRLDYDERRLMIERGLTPPPLPPEEPRRRWRATPEESLRYGMILLFLGVGMALGYVMLRSSTVPARASWLTLLSVGSPIVGFLGLGNLVYYYFATKLTLVTVRKLGIAQDAPPKS